MADASPSASIGVLASQDLSRLAGFSVLVSSGTLLAAIGVGAGRGDRRRAVLPGHLDARHRRLLPADRAGRARARAGRRRACRHARGLRHGRRGRRPAGPDEVGVAIPATMALLGLCFIACALLLAGLPPLPGLPRASSPCLPPLLGPAGSPVPATAWALLALLILSGLATIDRHGPRGHRMLLGVAVARTVPRVRRDRDRAGRACCSRSARR